MEPILDKLDDLRRQLGSLERDLGVLCKELSRELEQRPHPARGMPHEVSEFLAAYFETPESVEMLRSAPYLPAEMRSELEEKRDFITSFDSIWQAWGAFAQEKGLPKHTKEWLGRRIKKWHVPSRVHGKRVYRGLRFQKEKEGGGGLEG